MMTMSLIDYEFDNILILLDFDGTIVPPWTPNSPPLSQYPPVSVFCNYCKQKAHTMILTGRGIEERDQISIMTGISSYNIICREFPVDSNQEVYMRKYVEWKVETVIHLAQNYDRIIVFDDDDRVITAILNADISNVIAIRRRYDDN